MNNPTIQLSASDTADLVAGKVTNALDAYRQTGGTFPVTLAVHPDETARVKTKATERLLHGVDAHIVADERVPLGTIRLRQSGGGEVTYA